jgi:hypothetical protein
VLWSRRPTRRAGEKTSRPSRNPSSLRPSTAMLEPCKSLHASANRELSPPRASRSHSTRGIVSAPAIDIADWVKLPRSSNDPQVSQRVSRSGPQHKVVKHSWISWVKELGRRGELPGGEGVDYTVALGDIFVDGCVMVKMEAGKERPAIPQSVRTCNARKTQSEPVSSSRLITLGLELRPLHNPLLCSLCATSCAWCVHR